MKPLRFVLLAVAALCGGALFATPGAAMPVGKLGAALDIGAPGAQNVQYGCGPFSCWGGANYYYAAPLYAAPVYVAPPVYGPAYVIPYTSGPGWYGGWRRAGWYGGWRRPGWYGGGYRRAWW
jgi:hypothetical protein